MRVFPRVALVALVLLCTAPLAVADHLQADCPLTLVATNPPASNFGLSPHGVFRSGSQVYVLRGQFLTTYTVTELGDMQVAREDFIGPLGARETIGGAAFSNGYLFVTSESGLEIYDLTGVRANGNAPQLVSKTPNLHFRRLAVNGNLLAGLYPASDIPCAPSAVTCPSSIEFYNISNLAAPARVGGFASNTTSFDSAMIGYNDIAFNSGFLVATGPAMTRFYNVTNPGSPFVYATVSRAGTFLVSNGSSLVGVGQDDSIFVYTFSATSTAPITPLRYFTVDPSLRIDRANPIAFHPQASFDEAGNRLITLVDEINPQTGQPARTIAFDVFDNVPQFDGSNPRNFDVVSRTTGDEVKYNPVAVGGYVYTVGEVSGLQTWGACGVMAGKIEFENVSQLNCGGAWLHGWVTGTTKIANVEVLMDSGSLGSAPVAGVPRTDVPSMTPVFNWQLAVNLDATTKGEHLLRVVGTDAAGNRRQFASQMVYFPGPGQNCTVRRRQAVTKQ